MAETANLVEHVLPTASPLRNFVADVLQSAQTRILELLRRQGVVENDTVKLTATHRPVAQPPTIGWLAGLASQALS